MWMQDSAPPSDPIAAAKAEARRAAFVLRKVAHGAGAAAALAARDHFLAAGLGQGARIAAAYRPIRTEIDPTPLMLALRDQGVRLCVPVILGPARPLVFREWTPDSPMVPGAFGAAIPANGADLVPDLCLVPLLSFDAAGWRLGYGGGFYDRTLAGLRAAGGVRACGFAYAAQQVDAVITEPTDQRLDAIVTEAGVLRPAV